MYCVCLLFHGDAVPESEFSLTHSEDNNIVNIRCAANDVYPEPKIVIM